MRGLLLLSPVLLISGCGDSATADCDEVGARFGTGGLLFPVPGMPTTVASTVVIGATTLIDVEESPDYGPATDGDCVVDDSIQAYLVVEIP